MGECMRAASIRVHLVLRALSLTLMAGSIGASGQTASCMALEFLAGQMATDTRESTIRELSMVEELSSSPLAKYSEALGRMELSTELDSLSSIIMSLRARGKTGSWSQLKTM